MNKPAYSHHVLLWGKQKSRFTLVELLVVVAIIGILASMLLPSLSRARAVAQLKVCMSNQRQIGIAAQLYAETYDGQFVGDFNNEGQTDMFFASKYLVFLSNEAYTGPLNYGDMSDRFRETGAYQCPSAKLDVALDFTVNSIDTQHFDTNGGYKGVLAHRVATFPKSLNEVGYIVEANNQRAFNQGDNYHLWDIFSPDKFTFDASGGANSENNARSFHYLDQQHLGKMNMTFFDGHSKALHIQNGGITFAIFNPHL